MRPAIIGGKFGLETSLRVCSSSPPFLTGGERLLANGRSGILLLCDLLEPRKIWMPSYLCGSMLQGVPDRSMVRYYSVGRGLTISSDWLAEVSGGDLAVFIDYFGLLADRAMLAEARRRGAWVLEDACQALLTAGVGEAADFVLFSPRKFLGVPDGGILRGSLPAIELRPAPASWSIKAIAAVVLRREFDLYGGERAWRQLFHELEEECPVGRYAMNGLTGELLAGGFDYESICLRRRENYRTLSARLARWALFPELPRGSVPLGFPVRIPNRDAVLQKLFEQSIYPPVHWPISGVVPAEFAESHRLSAEIMTLLCDQRYGAEDMERMAGLVVECAGEDRE